MVVNVITGIVVVSVLLGLAFFITTLLYVKASPDEAYVISGRGDKRFLIGRGGYRIPWIEQVDKLPLSVIRVDVKTSDYVPTHDFINLKIDGNVLIKISSNPDLLPAAAENFLNKKQEYISSMVVDTLEANMREIVGTMTLKDMVQNRQTFAEKVMENAVPEMQKIGLDIQSFNVQHFNDENDVINDLGVDNVEQIKKDASIARSQAQRDIAIQESLDREVADVSRTEAERKMQKRQNELEIEKSKLDAVSNRERAIAESALVIEREEQRKQEELVRAEADRLKTEKAIEIEENRIKAEENLKADAEFYRLQKQAESEAYRLQKQAESELYIMQKEAEGITAKSLAESNAIKQKNEAMNTYSESLLIQDVLKAFVEMSANVVKPLESVDSIVLYGEGSSTKLVEESTRNMDQVNRALQQATGFDIQQLASMLITNKMTGLGRGPVDITSTDITE